MAFPSLTSKPLIDPYEESAAQDPVLRSPKEAGYVQTRPRFTRVPKKYHIVYGDLSDSDKASLASWESTTQYGASLDTWTHPKTGSNLNVRLSAPIKYKFNRTDSTWQAEFDLEEA